MTKPISATDATPVIDTTKFAFGRYYKFDIPATVKNIKDNDGVEFSNTANEIVHQYNPYNKQVTTPKKPTQTRENNVPVPLEFNYTKKLEGRELTAGEFSFLLKDQDGKVLQTVSNDKDGHIKSLIMLQQVEMLQMLTTKSSTTRWFHQKNLSSNQRNML